MESISINFYDVNNIDGLISMSPALKNGSVGIPYSEIFSSTKMFATKLNGLIHCFELKLPTEAKSKILVFDRTGDCLQLIFAEQFNENHLFLGTHVISFLQTLYQM